MTIVLKRYMRSQKSFVFVTKINCMTTWPYATLSAEFIFELCARKYKNVLKITCHRIRNRLSACCSWPKTPMLRKPGRRPPWLQTTGILRRSPETIKKKLHDLFSLGFSTVNETQIIRRWKNTNEKSLCVVVDDFENYNHV